MSNAKFYLRQRIKGWCEEENLPFDHHLKTRSPRQSYPRFPLSIPLSSGKIKDLKKSTFSPLL